MTPDQILDTTRNTAKDVFKGSCSSAFEAIEFTIEEGKANFREAAQAQAAFTNYPVSPDARTAFKKAASDCRTCQHLSEAWGVCSIRPKCVGGEQYVHFPLKQLWDKTPRNDGQAAHQEMREALHAEFYPSHEAALLAAREALKELRDDHYTHWQQSDIDKAGRALAQIDRALKGDYIPSMREQLLDEYRSGLDSPPENSDADE